jgi:hypothetical protein
MPLVGYGRTSLSRSYAECIQSFLHANVVLFAQVTKVDFILNIIFLKVVVGQSVEAGRHDFSTFVGFGLPRF